MKLPQSFVDKDYYQMETDLWQAFKKGYAKFRNGKRVNTDDLLWLAETYEELAIGCGCSILDANQILEGLFDDETDDKFGLCFEFCVSVSPNSFEIR